MSDTPVVAVGKFATTQAPEETKAEVTAPAVETPVKTDPLAPKFAALTRMDRDIKAKQAAFQAERKAFEAEKAELAKWREERDKGVTDYKSKLKTNPLQFLEENEVPFDQLVEMKLNDGKMTPEKLVAQMRADIDSKYGQELENLKASLKEKEDKAAQDSYDAAENGFKSSINDFLNSVDEKDQIDNKTTYEIIHAQNRQDLVFDVIKEHYETTKAESADGNGRILSIKEAADAVEAHLYEELKKNLELKKFKQTSTPAKETKQTAPTLSNTMSSEVPIKGEKQLSKEESLKNAAKMIRWVD